MSVTVFSAVLDQGVVVPITLEFSSSHHGLPGISFVGTPRSSIGETRERIFSTFRSMKLSLPRAKVTVNMLPVDVPKQGSSLDLALAIGLLMLYGIIPERSDIGAIGELGLSGEIRTPHGLPLLVEALEGKRVFTSYETKELSLVSTPEKVYPCRHLRDVMADLQEGKNVPPLSELETYPRWWEDFFSTEPSEERLSRGLSDVLSLALVGGHHLLVYGSPGVGKSHMKTYIPSLLPPLSSQEMRTRVLRNTALSSGNELYSRVLAPHTSATIPGLLGGGSPFRP